MHTAHTLEMQMWKHKGNKTCNSVSFLWTAVLHEPLSRNIGYILLSVVQHRQMGSAGKKSYTQSNVLCGKKDNKTSNIEKLQTRMRVTPKCYVYSCWKGWICRCKMLYFRTSQVNMNVHTLQHKVSACCCCMNRKIRMPTSHHEINCEFLSTAFFVVATAAWVEVWKKFSHVSFCFVGGFWIWLLNFDLSPLVGRDGSFQPSKISANRGHVLLHRFVKFNIHF